MKNRTYLNMMGLNKFGYIPSRLKTLDDLINELESEVQGLLIDKNRNWDEYVDYLLEDIAKRERRNNE